MRRNLEKEHLLKLTLAAYKVTAIFPVRKDGEDLGHRINELADRVLRLAEHNGCAPPGGAPNGDIYRYIGEIMELFDEAEEKNLADQRNFLVLRREYAGYLAEPSFYNLAQPSNRGKTVENSDEHRQDKIIKAINGSGKVKIGELVSLFPGLNRRTVLRDLDKLCQTGVMVRNGNGRGAYYVKNWHKCDIPQEMSQ